jgi:hypothetical protein
MSRFAMPKYAERSSTHRDGGSSTDDSNSKRALDRRLDQALEDTFPASDPISIIISGRKG